MPASGERTGRRPGRTGQSSCDFCRARKLRCNRPLPCTSCVSRGKTCQFQNINIAGSNAPTPATDVAQQKPPLTATGILSPSKPTDQGDLRAEIEALKKLTHNLGQRIENNTHNYQHENNSEQSSLSPTAISSTSTSTTGLSSWVDVLPTPSSSSTLGPVGEVVAHLERVSMGQSSHEPIPIYVDDLMFKVGPIRNIPQAPIYTAQLGKPTRCVWLPRHFEARVLLDRFIIDISYIHHVLHHPSLPAAIDDVYRQLDGQEPVKPGHLVLLLAIIATATHVWIPPDDRNNEASLFLSSAQANSQTPLWIKATHDLLNAGQNCSEVTLETIQGIIILSFLLCNVEGVSLRYRSLISTGLLLSRELGFHRVDHESNAANANTLQSEMGRRVWWYLAATDWLLAARYGGPGEGVYQVHPLQMNVNKPRNANDVDLQENAPHLELPLSQPTEMSYFLQRVRLAEISRSIVDHNLMGVAGQGRPSYYAHVMAMDFELDQVIHNIPSFFQLDIFEHSPESNKTSGIFIQAYLLNLLMHTQRCKLHLSYLKSGLNNNPAYASSRETCLNSARQIIRAEKQLSLSQHPFVHIRLRLPAILHGVFMASIVLLMDACVNRPGSVQNEIHHGYMAEALRIIEHSKSYSLAAANLHESLMQVLAKHYTQPQQQGGTSSPSVMRTTTPSVTQRPDSLGLMSSPNQFIANGPVGAFLDPLPSSNGQPAQSSEDLIYLDSFQWDDLFSGIDSSSLI